MTDEPHLPPGVHVEETSLAPGTIAADATHIGAVVGITVRGPTPGPTRVESWQEFADVFGGLFDPRTSPGPDELLPWAIQGFFSNGGRTLWVARIVGSRARPAEMRLEGDPDTGSGNAAPPLLRVRARDPGSWGNDVSLQVSRSSRVSGRIEAAGRHRQGWSVTLDVTRGLHVGSVLELGSGARVRIQRIDHRRRRASIGPTPSTVRRGMRWRSVEFDLSVEWRPPGGTGVQEFFPFLSLDPEHPRYALRIVGSDPNSPGSSGASGDSRLIHLADETLDASGRPVNDASGLRLRSPREGRGLGLGGGEDDLGGLDGTGFVGTEEDPRGIRALDTVEEIRLVAVPGRTGLGIQRALIDHCERKGNRFAILDAPPEATTADALKHRENFDSSRAALYHPWLVMSDSRLSTSHGFAAPPSGHVMGGYARTDTSRGVWKAPANVSLAAARGLVTPVGARESELLNPAHVNCIRDFRAAGRGIRIWGARTLSSDPELRYIPARRLLLFVEASIEAGLAFADDEPNDQNLWSEVRTRVANFLFGLWRDGALAGPTPDEAFFVQVGRTLTVTDQEVADGRLKVELGLAVLRPAEYVVLRLERAVASP